VRRIDFDKREQKEPWYLKINPNGRIPTIVDHDNAGFPVFESGALMIYLAEKAGALLPTDVKGRSLVIQWLMFQMGGVGPMMGQANVFYRYAPEKIPYAIDRYHRELPSGRSAGHTTRDHEYRRPVFDRGYRQLVVGRGLNGRCRHRGPDHLKRWLAVIGERPAVQRGVDVPEPVDLEELLRKADEAKAKVQGILV
jgi:glutathione S-transferase